MLQLRPYQQAALDGLYNYWAKNKNGRPILVVPTGGGKSLIMAKVIEDAVSNWNVRVMVLAHVKELLEQNAKEYHLLTGRSNFAFYSASIGQKRADQQVTFAGIQSIYKKAYDIIPPPELIIIDECHLVPPDEATRYGKFLSDLRVVNPNVVILGLTATPYRTKKGMLHEGPNALFDGIAYEIGVKELIDQGYLCPLISKGSLHSIDTRNITITGGDFNEKEMEGAALADGLVRLQVEEIVRLGQGRSSWLIFGCGVRHAEEIAIELGRHGIAAPVVTGATDKKERTRYIEDLKAGRVRALVNVNVLTTGFNAPNIDLIVLVRATVSPGLYVQMVGRGTRLSPGKENCLVLDYGGNVMRHGPVDAVRIKKRDKDDPGEAPQKMCENCQAIVAIAARVCPECEHPFPEPEKEEGEKAAYKGAILSDRPKCEWRNVTWVSYRKHKKEGKPDSICVVYTTENGPEVREWLCPDHGGFAAAKYQQRLVLLGGEARTTEDALKECATWKWPARLKLQNRVSDSRYQEIRLFDYATVNPRQAEAGEHHRLHADDWIGEDVPF